MDEKFIEELNDMYPLVVVNDNGESKLTIDAEEVILLIEKRKKDIIAVEDNMKACLKKEMENKGIQRLISDKVGIYFNPAQENLERFDKDKFKEENPDLYDEYVKMDGKRSAYITIKTKWLNRGK